MAKKGRPFGSKKRDDGGADAVGPLCLDFAEAVADWGDKQAIEVSLERDEYEGWYARAKMPGITGTVQVMVNQFKPRKKDKKVDLIEYAAKVNAAFSAAAREAHHKRVGVSMAFGKAA